MTVTFWYDNVKDVVDNSMKNKNNYVDVIDAATFVPNMLPMWIGRIQI